MERFITAMERSNVGAATQAQVFLRVKGILKDAHRRGIIGLDPLLDVSPPEYRPGPTVIPTTRERLHPVRRPRRNELRGKLGAQTSNAAKDENSVIFAKKQLPEFQKLRAELDAAIAAQHGAQETGPAPSASLADELAKLANLRDQGILSPTEFEQQKRRLLGL
ncbi:SHOCT domain-containing protein [[Kitasatospora] papulosa]|uniref:SHOCT domain-containing protein n=1 Tax=[Kitasatospora] papulosa TaxID=1464011 RepID=UPI00380E6B89